MREVVLASGAMPEELMDEGNLQQLLQQIQQDTGSKPSRVPEGGQEVTPTAGYGVHPALEHDNPHIYIWPWLACPAL